MHFRASRDGHPRPPQVGNTIFADGGGAAVVAHAGFRGRRPRSTPPSEAAAQAAAAAALPPADRPHGGLAMAPPPPLRALTAEWEIGDMACEVIPGTAAAMSWRAGGVPCQYDMWLDRSIPGAHEPRRTCICGCAWGPWKHVHVSPPRRVVVPLRVPPAMSRCWACSAALLG